MVSQAAVALWALCFCVGFVVGRFVLGLPDPGAAGVAGLAVGTGVTVWAELRD